jgi:hypothetical protein
VKLPRLLAIWFLALGTSIFCLPFANAGEQSTGTLSAPFNVTAAVDTTTVTVRWSNPGDTSVTAERFAVMWQTSTSNGWGIASYGKSIEIPIDIIRSSAGNGTIMISVRADNDTLHVYSNWSQIVTIEITPPVPIVPEVLPSPEPTPTPSLVPVVEPSPSPTPTPTVAPLPQPTVSPTPEPLPTSTPVLPEPSPIPSSVNTSTPAPVPPTQQPDPMPLPTPLPEPVRPDPVPEPPVVIPVPEPSPVPVPQPEPEPQPVPVEEPPTPEPEPEPAPEEQAPPALEPEAPPAVEPEPPVEAPEPPAEAEEPPPEEVPAPVVPEPAPEYAPEPPAIEPEPPVVATKDSTPEERAEVAATLIEEARGEPVTAAAIQAAGLTYEDLPPETPVEVRTDEDGNEVVITAEVAAALVVLESPAALLEAIFTDPAQALLAIASIGADMSDEERTESEKIIVASVIAGQAAVTAAGAAGAYRRKP